MEIELPTPPKPVIILQIQEDQYVPVYGRPFFSEDQMQEYARTAVLAERERIAHFVEGHKFWEVIPDLKADIEAAGLMDNVMNLMVYGAVAAAIRKGE